MRFLSSPWKHDHKSKRFTSKALNFGALPILQKTLGRPRIPALDQGHTLHCAIYAAVMNGKYIHGEDFSIDWQKNKVERLQGFSVDKDGSNPNAAMDSQTYSKDGGYLPKKEWDPIKTEILDKEATNYSNEGYMKPASGSDIFDSICMELQRHYNPETKKGACVQLFTGWYSTFYPPEVRTLGMLEGYHSYLAIDFDRTNVDPREHFLIVQNSYGERVGNKGFHKFYRGVVNDMLSKWGMTAKIPAPLTKEQIALAKQATPMGEIQRSIINIFYAITLYLVKLYGTIKEYA